MIPKTLDYRLFMPDKNAVKINATQSRTNCLDINPQKYTLVRLKKHVKINQFLFILYAF